MKQSARRITSTCPPMEGMRCFLLFLLIPGLHAIANCSAADAQLKDKRAFICDSLAQGQTWWCGNDWQREPKAAKDWPSQVVYLHSLLDTMVGTPPECFNTSYFANTVSWLNYAIMAPNVSGNFGYTWDVFQAQYYDTPRKPGNRIESPDTLGRKCWAFAYLAERWDPGSFAKFPYSLANFTKIYEASVPFSMQLCEKVQANCFVNASYDPTRNGTCKTKQFEFHYLGFDRENIKRENIIQYPWW